jgi:hypothetical protein
MGSRLRTIAVMGVLAVLGYAARPAAQSDFQWRGQIAAGQRIEIKGVNGDVRAVLASGPDVEVAATRSARRSNPDDVRIEVVPHGGGVTICAVYPDVPGREPNRCDPGGNGSSHTKDNDTVVRFTVRVPAGVAFVGRTVNGDVDGEALRGDAEGHTVNGSVKLSTTGLAIASTVNGSVTASMGRADGPEGAHFSTVNGAVTLTLPAVVNADVRAETVNGSIVSDFPITITGPFNRRRLQGTIGSGGRELRLSSVNGSITLRKDQ